MINITLTDEAKTLFGQYKINLIFPSNITISEMLKAIYLKFGYDNRSLLFHTSFSDKNEKLKNIFFHINNIVYVSKGGELMGGNIRIFGKPMKANLLMKNNKFVFEIGTLNSNKQLAKNAGNYIVKKIKKLYINKKKLNLKEEKSLLSLGIKDNFDFMVEYDDIYN